MKKYIWYYEIRKDDSIMSSIWETHLSASEVCAALEDEGVEILVLKRFETSYMAARYFSNPLRHTSAAAFA